LIAVGRYWSALVGIGWYWLFPIEGVAMNRTTTGNSRPRSKFVLSVLAAVCLSGAVTGCSDGGSQASERKESSKPNAGKAGTGKRVGNKKVAVTTSTGTARDVAKLMDPAVRKGVLANGLTYLIRRNTTASPSADFRLVVNVGSAHETKTQAGIAHFLEHMLFNGTKKYPGTTVQKAIDEIGGTWNAATSFDNTTYQVTVPNPKPEMLRTSIGVLREWLSEATLSDKDTIEERGVIVEERRTRNNEPQFRAMSQALNLWFKGSSYENHEVIGTVESVTTMTGERAREFYSTWYRPDNAGIIVVGDIDVDAVEKSIQEQFGSVKNPVEKLKRTKLRGADKMAAATAVLSAKDFVTTAITLAFVRPTEVKYDAEGFRNQTAEAVLGQTLNNRFKRQINEGTLQLTNAMATIGLQPFEGFDFFSIDMTAEAGKAAVATTTVLSDLKLLARDGFPETEFEAARNEIKARYKSFGERRETIENEQFVTSLIQHFRFGAPVLSIDDELALADDVLKSMKNGDIQRALTKRMAQNPQVSIVGPAKDATKLPKEAELLAEVMKVRPAKKQKTVSPSTGSSADAKTSTTLQTTKDVTSAVMTSVPAPVKEESTKELSKLKEKGFEGTLLTFPNGVRVVINPTKIERGRVLLSGVRQGSALDVPIADISNVQTMTTVMEASGIGELNQAGFDNAKAASATELSFSIEELSTKISASTSPSNLEVMAQLVHVALTKPRFEAEALKRVVDTFRPIAEDPLANPNLALLSTLATARFGTDPRFAFIPTVKDLESVSIDGMAKTWSSEFGNANGWVYVLAGDLSMADGVRIARTYFGSLPGSPRTNTAAPVPPRPEKVIAQTVKTGVGDKAVVAVTYSEPFTYDDSALLVVRTLEKVLYQRLFDGIREKAGATYSPQVRLSALTYPTDAVDVSIDVSTDPNKTDIIAKTIQDEVAKIRSSPVTPEELNRAVEQVRADYAKTDLKLVAYLQTADVIEGRNYVESLARVSERINAISAQQVQQLASQLLPGDRYIQVIAAA
jgi:zinc protease